MHALTSFVDPLLYVALLFLRAAVTGYVVLLVTALAGLLAGIIERFSCLLLLCHGLRYFGLGPEGLTLRPAGVKRCAFDFGERFDSVLGYLLQNFVHCEHLSCWLSTV